jgi:hypothetical protein
MMLVLLRGFQAWKLCNLYNLVACGPSSRDMTLAFAFLPPSSQMSNSIGSIGSLKNTVLLFRAVQHPIQSAYVCAACDGHGPTNRNQLLLIALANYR